MAYGENVREYSGASVGVAIKNLPRCRTLCQHIRNQIHVPRMISGLLVTICRSRANCFELGVWFIRGPTPGGPWRAP